MTSACKQSFKKLTFFSLGIGFLALTSPLSAENSGFYGSVGFQYSNMTRAEATNGGGVMPGGNIANPFLNAQNNGLTSAAGNQPTATTMDPQNHLSSDVGVNPPSVNGR
ncbi:hypothetical protein [Helicobacter heilmannii]|uniref:hypothetical protein n=1 Tax=Helicobacter heilmannii TaxID=35817 RepID=UPI000CF19D6D|nr:hypothetical protein [Helicobacter heilmannii]